MSNAETPGCAADDREGHTTLLRKVGWLQHDNPQFFHGRGYDGPMQDPETTWASHAKPRKDHDAPDWLTASEFHETDSVLDHKCRALSQLLQMSRKTVLSTAPSLTAAPNPLTH